MPATDNPEQQVLKEVISVKVKGLLIGKEKSFLFHQTQMDKITLQWDCCWGTWGQLWRSDIAFELRKVMRYSSIRRQIKSFQLFISVCYYYHIVWIWSKATSCNLGMVFSWCLIMHACHELNRRELKCKTSFRQPVKGMGFFFFSLQFSWWNQMFFEEQ